jgi:hypothetical protein
LPGLDHEVHPSTRIGEEYRHGCWNLPRPRNGDGYWAPHRIYREDGSYSETQRFIKFSMSTECRNDVSLTDPHCEGCGHRGSGELYSEKIRSSGT